MDKKKMIILGRRSGKTETIYEFLKRGGKITKVPVLTEPEAYNFVGPSSRSKKFVTYDDIKDGLSPNLRWLRGKNE